MTNRISLTRIAASKDFRLIVLIAALVVLFGSLIGDRLFGELGLRSMAYQLPELGLLSLAMMVSMLSGGIDLSIIATANLSALAIAYALSIAPPELGFSALALGELGAVLSGLVVAATVGAFNGFIIGYLRVSPILATLGSMTLVKGLAIGLTHGSVLSGFTPAIVFLGNGSVFGLPMALIIFVAVAALLSALLTLTPFGVRIAMFGSNERAVRFSGVDTRALSLRMYVLVSLLAFFAGLVMMARFNSANAAYGESYLLVTILAGVLGGVDPSGGFGRVSGVVLALIVLQIISTACVVLGLSQFLTLAIWGGILIAVGARRGALGRRRWWSASRRRS
jgi:simple sugar transport system permease protein